MPKKLKAYVLSKEADLDLEAIFDYTEIEFGFHQAVIYLNDLEAVFQLLVKNPEIGRKREELRFGLYSIVEQKHTIFYTIANDDLRIVRVLHGNKDIPLYF